MKKIIYAAAKPEVRVYTQTLVNHKNNALQWLARGEKEKALEEFALHIARDPKDFDALHLSGVLIFELGNQHRGLAFMEKAREQGASPHFDNNYGNMLLQMGQSVEAEASFGRALAQNPSYAEAHSNLGNLLVQRRELLPAIASYDKALTLKPELADAWANRAIAKHQLKHYQAAQGDFESALALPNPKESYYCAYADLLMDLDAYAEAQVLLEKALQINSTSSNCHNSLGRLKTLLGEYRLAIESFMVAITADPLNTQAYKNAAIACYRLGDAEGSQSLIKEALNLDPTNIELRWLDCFLPIPAAINSRDAGLRVRERFAKKLERFSKLENRHELDVSSIGNVGPFYLMYHGFDDRQLYERYAAVAMDIIDANDPVRQILSKALQKERIKICLVNAQIKNHSVWHSHTEGLYKRIDRTTFELHTINLTGVTCIQAEYAKERSESYYDAASGDDESVVEKILSLGADIVLYPEVGLHAQTWRLAARRLCVQQVAMWGNPETTGLPSIDYFVSVQELEGANAAQHYSESLVSLPLQEHYYASRQYDGKELDLASLGLVKEKKIILCSGAAFKYQYRFFEVFTKLYQKFEGLQFVFFDQKDEVSEQLKKSLAEIARSAPRRNCIVFLPWLDEASYYALMRVSHLMLEGLNFSGFNTAIKSIECGLPIVSVGSALMRENFSAGLLRAIGANECVAEDDAGAVEVFTKLLKDQAFHQEMRQLMLTKKKDLFDMDGPVPQLESFFKLIVKNEQSRSP